MLIPGDGGEITIGSVSDEVIVESEETEELANLFNSDNHDMYLATRGDNTRTADDLGVQPSAQLSAGVKLITNRNEGTASCKL